MLLKQLLEERDISMYRLSKMAEVSKSTITEICNGTLSLEKCNAGTVYKIAKALTVSMEDLLSPCFEERCSFELFKSNLCHQLKETNDIQFLINHLKADTITKYAEREWFAECFYLLAMVDYLCRINEVPLCTKYQPFRSAKLSEVLYPAGVLAIASVEKNDRAMREAYNNSIPEFLRHNIIEVEVRNVI